MACFTPSGGKLAHTSGGSRAAFHPLACKRYTPLRWKRPPILRRKPGRLSGLDLRAACLCLADAAQPQTQNHNTALVIIMGNSKHHLWQKRWHLDTETGAAKHETGLVCRWVPGSALARKADTLDVQGADDVAAALAIKNGHNARAMVARLIAEGQAVLAAGSTFKARL